MGGRFSRQSGLHLLNADPGIGATIRSLFAFGVMLVLGFPGAGLSVARAEEVVIDTGVTAEARAQQERVREEMDRIKIEIRELIDRIAEEMRVEQIKLRAEMDSIKAEMAQVQAEIIGTMKEVSRSAAEDRQNLQAELARQREQAQQLRAQMGTVLESQKQVWREETQAIRSALQQYKGEMEQIRSEATQVLASLKDSSSQEREQLRMILDSAKKDMSLAMVEANASLESSTRQFQDEAERTKQQVLAEMDMTLSSTRTSQGAAKVQAELLTKETKLVLAQNRERAAADRIQQDNLREEIQQETRQSLQKVKQEMRKELKESKENQIRLVHAKPQPVLEKPRPKPRLKTRPKRKVRVLREVELAKLQTPAPKGKKAGRVVQAPPSDQGLPPGGPGQPVSGPEIDRQGTSGSGLFGGPSETGLGGEPQGGFSPPSLTAPKIPEGDGTEASFPKGKVPGSATPGQAGKGEGGLAPQIREGERTPGDLPAEGPEATQGARGTAEGELAGRPVDLESGYQLSTEIQKANYEKLVQFSNHIQGLKKDLERSRGDSSKNPKEVYQNLAQAYLEAQQHLESLKPRDQAELIYVKGPSVALGSNEIALWAFKMALTQDPADPDLNLKVAGLYEKLKDWVNARRYYRAAEARLLHTGQTARAEEVKVKRSQMDERLSQKDGSAANGG